MIGETLRAARAKRGIDLSEVERVTRIRVKFLRAMEAEEWDALPGAAYARGFLDTYARFLGLDAPALVREFESHHDTALPLEEIPETMLPQRGELGRSRFRGPRGLATGLLLAAAALGVLAVVVLTGGDSGDRDRLPAERSEAHRGAPASSGSTPAPDTTSTTPSEDAAVLLSMRSTGTVWVCLVDGRGRPMVNGEILTADEVRGPFRSRSFEITVGNGALELEANDEPVAIPDRAEPLSYRITAEGAKPLDPGLGPSCA
jgi:cytoskeleton protein RodZ